MIPARLLNSAWMLWCSRENVAFRRATRRVAHTQASVLVQILKKNETSLFGRTHGFASVKSIRDYQRQVPLSVYDDYAEPIRLVASGEAGVLTCERVDVLQPTSGTSGGEKLIPCTAALRRQFQHAVAAWIGDLYRRRPAVREGRAYWSVSPAFGSPRRTSGGIPIGFDDTAYLGAMERWAMRRLLVVPPELARADDMQGFVYCSLLCLLRCEDLALVSIWSPTFLPALLAPLERWQEQLIFDVGNGTLTPPGPVDSALARALRRRLADKRRASRLASILRSSLSLPEKLRQIWPRLAVISCWADAAAALASTELRALFPAVEIQGKGLLATEGCVSFPLIGRAAPVLAIRSHFFEFQEADGTDCRLAHELEERKRYRVILTTGGGLYRYQLRDEVEVAGFENQCPLLRFVGKADRVSDLVGEKLAEPHVRSVLDRLVGSLRLVPRFALVAAVAGRPARYRLFLQLGAEDMHTEGITRLAAGLNSGLSENPYYRHALRVGQLAPADVHVLSSSAESAWRIYERRCLANGQRAGNIKPVALDLWTGWSEAFAAAGLVRESA
jgi:hypothetical protein